MDNKFFEKVKKDLKKSGFRSELEARKILSDNGWSLSGGSAYFDKDEEKSREIDIVAHRGDGIKYGERSIVDDAWFLFIEVKKTEKPWVVFKTKTKKPFDSCAWNNIINSVNLPCKPSFLTKGLQEFSLLKVNGWEGTGIHEAFKNPNQPSKWYSAFLSACKAAVAYEEKHGSEGEKLTSDILKDPTEISFHQPVVVLDGVLLSAELDINNELRIDEVNSAAFKFEYLTKNYKDRTYRVDVVTLNGLAEYIEIVKNRQHAFSEALIKQIKKKFKKTLNTDAIKRAV